MSRNSDEDIAFIRALAEILRANDLTELEVARGSGDDDGLTVRLSRAVAAAPSLPAAPAAAAPAGLPVVAPHAAEGAATAAPDLSDAITSPMVGTVYLSAEPGAAPFVAVGDTVAEGQTILIIEAMKTMNQIPSPRGGVVRAILVSNAEPVEYGAPLMVIA